MRGRLFIPSLSAKHRRGSTMGESGIARRDPTDKSGRCAWPPTRAPRRGPRHRSSPSSFSFDCCPCYLCASISDAKYLFLTLGDDCCLARTREWRLCFLSALLSHHVETRVLSAEHCWPVQGIISRFDHGQNEPSEKGLDNIENSRVSAIWRIMTFAHEYGIMQEIALRN